MTYGRGLGVPWGGGPLIPVEQPLSEIAGDPTTFVFADEPDGPLPGNWEHYVFDHDGAGALALLAEPDPPAFFRVVGGIGLWDYTRSPTLPGPTDPFTERGFAAGPRNVLEGRNARVKLIARQPTLLVDPSADELWYSVGIAVRLQPVGQASPAWVGARMRSRWEAGVWTEPLILETLAATGGPAVVTDSLVPFPTPDPLDIWKTQPNAELEVEIVGEEMTATVSGLLSLTVQVPGGAASQVAFLVSVYNRTGPSILAVPSVVAAQFQSLRDLDNLGPPQQIPGALHLDAPVFTTMIRLPLNQLIDQGIVKRIRGRQFRFLQETTVEVIHNTYRFGAGEVVRANEDLGTQTFVPVTRDLHYERTRKD